jgi:predicted esterase
VLIGDGLRRAYLRVPPSYSASHGAPLIILLHGAGGSGSVMLDAFRSQLDAAGAIGLAPDALNLTWDMFDGASLFASDVPFVNDMLDQTFARCAVDTNRVSLLGFSDGASYALTVGIANADQLRSIVAFSPGTYSVSNPHGPTGVFTAHGTLDPVFSAENAATIDAQLRARSFHVTHDEFDGGHEVPDPVAEAAFEWMETQPMAG